jgi:predicted MFS family arabinose efflux permease
MEGKVKVVLSPQKIFILAVLGFTQATIYLMPYMTGVFYDPFLEILGIDNTQFGFLMTIYGTITIFAALPGGWIADKVDTKKLITICLLMTGCLGVIAGFFMVYSVYCVIWALFSIVGNLMFWSAAMKTVRFVGDEHEQGKAYGYFYAFNFGSNSLSSAVGVAILAGFSASVILGMRYIFLFFSLLCFLCAFLVWKFVATIDYKKQPAEGEVIEKEKTTLRDILSVLRRKEIWMFSIIGFCCYSILGVSYYFTPYFGDVMGLNVASAGIIYVMTGPATILFGPVLGTLADWMRSTVKLITILMALTVGLLLVMLVFKNVTLTTAIAIDVLVAITGGGAYNIMFASVEDLGLSRKVAGTCIGLATIIAYSPDVFMYVLFGNWLDTYGNDGYARIFAYSAVLAAVAVVIGTYLYFSVVKKNKLELAAVSNAEAISDSAYEANADGSPEN